MRPRPGEVPALVVLVLLLGITKAAPRFAGGIIKARVR